MFGSLRSRLALSNLLITLLGLVVVVFVFTNLLPQTGIDVKKQELRKQSAAVAKQVEQLLRNQFGEQSKTQLLNQIDSDSTVLGERVIIVDRTGRRVIADSARKTPFFTGYFHFNQLALHSGQTASQSLLHQNLILFQSPIHGTEGRGIAGAVLLVARPADVSAGTSTLLRLVSIAAGTALLVWLLIGFYFTYSISRPLHRITVATTEMARGNYSARVKMRAQGEIDRLANSFNHMAGQVQRSNQVLKDFLANVSHDLRTPLTMITGFSQALVDGTARPGEVRSSAEVIHEEALKMQRLVDDLMQLTRLESGLLTPEPHPLDVRPFVQSSVDRCARGTPNGSVALIENLVPADTPPINVDPEQLERVLGNLLENALHYTRPEGSIRVRSRVIDAQWVELSIEDTGIGIPTEDLPRIFERFYRSDKSRERGQGHSGLGLAIVREIVEAHGGRVAVASEPEKGTTFRFSMPRAEGAEGTVQAAAPKETVRRAAAQ